MILKTRLSKFKMEFDGMPWANFKCFKEKLNITRHKNANMF